MVSSCLLENSAANWSRPQLKEQEERVKQPWALCLWSASLMVCTWLEGTTAFDCCNAFTHVLILWGHKPFYLVLQSQGQVLCILEKTLGYRHWISVGLPECIMLIYSNAGGTFNAELLVSLGNTQHYDMLCFPVFSHHPLHFPEEENNTVHEHTSCVYTHPLQTEMHPSKKIINVL